MSAGVFQINYCKISSKEYIISPLKDILLYIRSSKYHQYLYWYYLTRRAFYHTIFSRFYLCEKNDISRSTDFLTNKAGHIVSIANSIVFKVVKNKGNHIEVTTPNQFTPRKHFLCFPLKSPFSFLLSS